jgi:cell division protein FtsA
LIGVRGGHIQTFNHHGAMNIARTDKEITLADRDQVVESTKAVPISPDREIVHVIPAGFYFGPPKRRAQPRRHGSDAA